LTTLNRTFAFDWQALATSVVSFHLMKTLLSTLLVAVAALTAGVPAASAATRSYEGTVVSVDRDSRTFRLRDAERGTVTIKVTSSTRFERISGFSGLRAGARNIETTVRRSGGRWVAVHVERSGGGGNHNDDAVVDDHGSHGGSHG
jgi:hypothetical protein